MLNKIINITAGSGFQSSGKPGKYYVNRKAGYFAKFDLHDSVNISPALLFLNEINWQLKSINYIDNQKLFIVFTAFDFQFQVTLDFVNIKDFNYLDYSVIKDRFNELENKRMMVDMSVKINNVKEYSSYNISSLDNLEILAERLFRLNVRNELNQQDSELLNDLFDGIYTGLIREFDYLNDSLFIFVEKLTGRKLSLYDFKNDSLNESIILKKIKSINV